MRPYRVRTPLLLLLAAATLPAAACQNTTTLGTGSPGPSAEHQRASGTDVRKVTPADVRALPAAGPRHHQGYSRDQFGPAWADVDHNHCDTRDDILARDLRDVVRSGNCTVTSGTLHDPYTGKTIHFTRGRATSTAVQIDHTVPLGLAWDLGAWQWPAAERQQYANDPLVLVAADGPANEAKGDSGPAEWTPAHDDWCAYATRFTAILIKYRLPVTAPDRAKLTTMLQTC